VRRRFLDFIARFKLRYMSYSINLFVKSSDRLSQLAFQAIYGKRNLKTQKAVAHAQRALQLFGFWFLLRRAI
jgi:hypothetical protein